MEVKGDESVHIGQPLQMTCLDHDTDRTPCTRRHRIHHRAARNLREQQRVFIAIPTITVEPYHTSVCT